MDSKRGRLANGWPAATTRFSLPRNRCRCRAQDGQRLDLVDDQRTDEVLDGGLAGLPRAAVVVEETTADLSPHVNASVAAERLAEIQAQFPAVPIVFCETRPLAEEWTYRWLGACQYERKLAAGVDAGRDFARSGRVRQRATDSAEAGWHPYVGSVGRIECAGQGTNSAEIRAAWTKPIKWTSRAPEAARAP